MSSFLMKDSNGNAVQLMELSAPQTVVVKAIADVATANLSAVITNAAIRVTATVDTWLTFTTTALVTAATGHFIVAGTCYDLPRPSSLTKISVIAVGSAVGAIYLSELG